MRRGVLWTRTSVPRLDVTTQSCGRPEQTDLRGSTIKSDRLLYSHCGCSRCLVSGKEIFASTAKKLCDENPETYQALPGHAELLKTFEKIFAPRGVLVSFKGLQYAVSFPPPPQRTALELRGPRVRFEDKTYQTWRVFGLQTMQLHSRHAGFLSLQKHDFKPEDTLVVFKPVHNLRHHLGKDILDGTESASAGVAGVMSGLPTAKRRKVDANPELFTRLVDTEVMRDRLEALRCRKPL